HHPHGRPQQAEGHREGRRPEEEDRRDLRRPQEEAGQQQLAPGRTNHTGRRGKLRTPGFSLYSSQRSGGGSPLRAAGMAEYFQTVVDTGATLGEADHLARHVVAWLADRGVVRPNPSQEGGYDRGPNAADIALPA